MAKKILVIDDEGMITKTVGNLLKREGYSVEISESGIQAIDKVKSIDFDLIVADIRMPQLDGIETIQRIRQVLKELGKRQVPEILITGYADEDSYKRALNLKVADYIYKPFDTKEFLDTIKRNLDVTKE